MGAMSRTAIAAALKKLLAAQQRPRSVRRFDPGGSVLFKLSEMPLLDSGLLSKRPIGTCPCGISHCTTMRRFSGDAPRLSATCPASVPASLSRAKSVRPRSAKPRTTAMTISRIFSTLCPIPARQAPASSHDSAYGPAPCAPPAPI